MREKKIRKERALLFLEEFKRIFPGKRKIFLNYSNPLEMLIAVILSAQCTDERVNMVTESLFRKYKTLDAYMKVSQKELEKDIFSTGFYKNKAKNIKAMVSMLKEEYQSVVPATLDELIRLPGVGRKTAHVVLGNIHGVTEGIAVDTHVRRFALKCDLTDATTPEGIEKDLMELFPKKEWQNLTYYCIRYGREICPARKHECREHPLSLLYPSAATRWPRAR